MTDFAVELLDTFGNKNTDVSFTELSRQFQDRLKLQNGISELQSEGYVKETSLLTYCITSVGRNHLRLVANKPVTHKVTTTPSKNAVPDNIKWYWSPWFKYVIWPLVVLLIGAYLLKLLGLT